MGIGLGYQEQDGPFHQEEVGREGWRRDTLYRMVKKIPLDTDS